MSAPHGGSPPQRAPSRCVVMAEDDHGPPSPDRPPRRGLSLEQVLERAGELRASGLDSRLALDQALREYEASGPGRRATIDALVRPLLRAHALLEGGTDPGDAIMQALNECELSDDLGAIARALWDADLHAAP
jgi:hypothetical protein